MIMPLGTYITPNRLIGLAADVCSADNAGIMLSTSGSARIEPIPRSTVRRGIAIFEMIIARPFTQKISSSGGGDSAGRPPTQADGRDGSDRGTNSDRTARRCSFHDPVRHARRFATPAESLPRLSYSLLTFCPPVVVS